MYGVASGRVLNRPLSFFSFSPLPLSPPPLCISFPSSFPKRPRRPPLCSLPSPSPTPPRRSAVAHPTARVARVGREQANGGTGGFDGRARPRGEQTARNSEEDGLQLGLRPAPSPPHAKHARTCHAGPFKRAHRSMGTPKAARTISEASQAGHQHASTPTTALKQASRLFLGAGNVRGMGRAPVRCG